MVLNISVDRDYLFEIGDMSDSERSAKILEKYEDEIFRNFDERIFDPKVYVLS
jgi:hypothetical protein